MGTMRAVSMPLSRCDGLRASLRQVLGMVAVLGALAMAASPALAQQDREHEALVRGLRMQQPSDPMWQAMMRFATDIKLTDFNPTTGFVPSNAKIFQQRFQWIRIPIYPGILVRGGFMVLSFEQADEANSYAKTTYPFEFQVERLVWVLRQTFLPANCWWTSCDRTAGG